MMASRSPSTIWKSAARGNSLASGRAGNGYCATRTSSMWISSDRRMTRPRPCPKMPLERMSSAGTAPGGICSTPELFLAMDLALIAKRLDAYERLVRLDKPIGALLLLWPTLWAVWLASAGQPALLVVVVFVLGTFLMRSAGCAIND